MNYGVRFLVAIISLASLLMLPSVCIYAQNMVWESDPTYRAEFGSPTAIAARPGGGLIVSTFGTGLYRTTSFGGEWMAASEGFTDTGALALLVAPEGALYAGTREKGVMKSVDSGATWMPANTGIEQVGVNAMVLGPDNAIYISTTQGIYVSHDNGNMWSRFGPWTTEVTSISLNERGRMAATVLNDRIYVRQDNEASWMPAAVPFLNDAMVFVAPSGTVYAGEDTLYQSTDGGTHWTPVIAGGAVRAMLVDRSGNLFLGTSTGVYVSTNGGASWDATGEGLTGQRIRTLAADSSGRMYAGTEAPMLFTRVLRASSVNGTVAAEGQGNGTIDLFAPNPSTGRSRVAFTIAHQGHARLAVCDQLGRELAVIAEGEYEPGTYTSTCDVSSLSAGAYHCVLTSNGSARTQPFVLLQ